MISTHNVKTVWYLQWFCRSSESNWNPQILNNVIILKINIMVKTNVDCKYIKQIACTKTKIHDADLLKLFSPTRIYVLYTFYCEWYIFVQTFVHILGIKKVCAGLNCACAWRASLFDDSCALWLLLKGGENLTTEGFLSLSFAARTFGGLERELNCNTHPYQSRLNSVLHTQPSN